MLCIIEAPNLCTLPNDACLIFMGKDQNFLPHAVVILFHVYEVIPGPFDSPIKSPSPNTVLMPPRVHASRTPGGWVACFSKQPPKTEYV